MYLVNFSFFSALPARPFAGRRRSVYTSILCNDANIYYSVARAVKKMDFFSLPPGRRSLRGRTVRLP